MFYHYFKYLLILCSPVPVCQVLPVPSSSYTMLHWATTVNICSCIYHVSLLFINKLKLVKVRKFERPVVAVSQKSSLEVSLEESRAELLALRTDRADTVNDLEAQVNQTLRAERRLSLNITPGGNLNWGYCSLSRRLKIVFLKHHWLLKHWNMDVKQLWLNVMDCFVLQVYIVLSSCLLNFRYPR